MALHLVLGFCLCGNPLVQQLLIWACTFESLFQNDMSNQFKNTHRLELSFDLALSLAFWDVFICQVFDQTCPFELQPTLHIIGGCCSYISIFDKTRLAFLLVFFLCALAHCITSSVASISMNRQPAWH